MHESKKGNCPCPQNGCVSLSGKLHGKHKCHHCGIHFDGDICPCIKMHCPCNPENKDHYPVSKGKDCPCVTLTCPCLDAVATSGC